MCSFWVVVEYLVLLEFAAEDRNLPTSSGYAKVSPTQNECTEDLFSCTLTFPAAPDLINVFLVIIVESTCSCRFWQEAIFAVLINYFISDRPYITSHVDVKEF